MGDLIQFGVDLTPEYIKEARKIIDEISDADAENIIKAVSVTLLHEIVEGLAGEAESVFYKMVESLYDEVTPHGCYFCDTSIDVYAVDFNKDTVICLSCRAKLRKRDFFTYGLPF